MILEAEHGETYAFQMIGCEVVVDEGVKRLGFHVLYTYMRESPDCNHIFMREYSIC